MPLGDRQSGALGARHGGVLADAHHARAIPEGHALARAEFNTIRLRLLKIAVRVVEHATRIRAHLPTSCVEKTLFRQIALGLSPSG